MNMMVAVCMAKRCGGDRVVMFADNVTKCCGVDCMARPADIVNMTVAVCMAWPSVVAGTD